MAIDGPVEEFSKKLLEGENPFPYPEPPHRPSFAIGFDSYLNWFKNLYDNRTRQDGTEALFIVGMPGAGKTRFLRHLDYLFYEKGSYQGIYAISRLSDQEIDEKEIWKQLFLMPDSTKRLASLVPKEKILAAEIRPDIKANVIKLIDQSLDMDLLSIEALRKVAEHTSNILPKESMICIALDNIEEYLDARTHEYLNRSGASPEEPSTKQKATAEAVNLLVGKIRNMTSDLRRAIVLLSLTTPAWAEVKKTEPARTKGRRFKFAEEEQVISELTLQQCFQLVHESMRRWCVANDVAIPIDCEDCMCTVGSEKLSTYPFTPMAIEFAWRVTDRYAGDITCFCSECINMMRNKGQVEVVKDELTIENLLKITKEYTWLGWADRARITLEEMGPTILEKALARKLVQLEKQIRTKYVTGIDTETIANSLGRFVDLLGVVVSPSPTVENSYNPSAKPIQPSSQLKIWSFEGTKIAVRYVIGEAQRHTPKAKIYGGRTELQDYVDPISLLDAGKATHALLILLWAVEEYPRIPYGLQRIMSTLGDTIMTIDLSEDIYKVIAVAEALEDQKDLAKFIDEFYTHLRERLALLIQQKRPAPPKPEKYTRYF